MLKKIVVLFLILLSLGSCYKKTIAKPAEKNPLLLVSISPYIFLTEQIAGPSFQVQTVVPPASNPHSYEPTSAQVKTLSQAHVWFRIGEPFEEKMVSVLKSRNPKFAVYDLRDGIDLIEEHHLGCKKCSMDHFDRHIWLSPKLAARQAEIIAKNLSEKFPEQKLQFQKNLTKLLFQLSALDLEIQEILKQVKNRLILVSHPAFAYFCKEYNFEQLSIEYEGKDPRPKHLEEILKRALAESMEVALALPQYNNKGAQLIAEKLRVPIHLIDPYSANYIETMRKLAHLIADPHAYPD